MTPFRGDGPAGVHAIDLTGFRPRIESGVMFLCRNDGAGINQWLPRGAVTELCL